ncbi:MAG: Clp protease N-terminal domain-containing protein, partial [Candidatus Peribacteraceae bacterium]|nr:Clp protease N-terminal domain-containing protein [Candidatus Peribacteraceae bacterium]
MNFSNYTTKAAEAVQGTMQLAGKLEQQALSPLHLLLVLLEQKEGLIPTLLQKLEKDASSIASRVQKEVSALPRVTGGGQPYLTPELKSVLDQAESEAGKLRDEYISTEHLFLALLDQKDTRKILDLDRNEALRILSELRGNQRVTDPDP